MLSVNIGTLSDFNDEKLNPFSNLMHCAFTERQDVMRSRAIIYIFFIDVILESVATKVE